MKPSIAIPLAIAGILATVGTAIANANGLFAKHQNLAYLFWTASIFLILAAIAISVLNVQNQRKLRAKKAIAKLLGQISECESLAYKGATSSEYDDLYKQIDQIKADVNQIAAKYLDSSFESSFLAVKVLDITLDEATKAHFIMRGQGSFWIMYQQLKAWRLYLIDVISDLNR